MKSTLFAIAIFCVYNAHAAPVLSAAQENAVATAVVTGEINAFTICQATLVQVTARQAFRKTFLALVFTSLLIAGHAKDWTVHRQCCDLIHNKAVVNRYLELMGNDSRC